MEVAGKGMDVRFVQPAQLRQSLLESLPFMELHAAFGQDSPQLGQLFRRQAVMLGLLRSGPEDQGEIDHSMAGHREGELRLALARPLDTRHDEGTGIEGRRKSAEPRLIVVLGAEIGEDRIREMPFEELRGPALPFVEELAQRLHPPFMAMAAQHLGGSGR